MCAQKEKKENNNMNLIDDLMKELYNVEQLEASEPSQLPIMQVVVNGMNVEALVDSGSNV